MATDTDTKTDDTTTQDDTQAATAAGKSGADQTTDKATEAEVERLRKQLKETNRKAEADRKFREDVEREKQEQEDQKLGEAARLQKQLKDSEDAKREADRRSAELEDKVISLRIDQAIERAAASLFTRPELASKLVDRARITYDPDTEKIGGIKDALEALLKQYPEIGSAQRGAGSPQAMRTKQAGSGNAQGGGKDQATGLREEFARLGDYEPM